MATFFELPLANDFPYFVVNSSGASVPASGFKLFLYQSGTTTKITSYTDSTGGTQNANPILLGATGLPQSGANVVGVWVSQGQTVKAVFAPSTDTDPPSSPIWTRDFGANPPGINDPTANLVVNSEWILGPTPTFISTTSFSLTGDQRANFQIDRRVKTTNSGGTVFSTISNSTFGAGITTVTVVNDSGVLDSGLSAVSYALLSATNRSVPPINVLVDQTDPSKKLAFSTSGITTGTTRTRTIQNLSDTEAIYGDFFFLSQGRLTLTTGVAVTTSDVTAATTLFFTPFVGGRIGLFNGTQWNLRIFSEISIAVPATTSTMYDVWVFDNSGTAALELLAWTNDTTRATALTTQNGILVKTGDATRRYAGSIRTTGASGQTEDSIAKRYVWNYYNRVQRKMLVQETTATWTYTTATYRQANANAANQLDMVIGISENPVTARVRTSATNGAVQFQVGIGIDSTTVNSADLFPYCQPGTAGAAAAIFPASAEYVGFPGVGRHFLTWLEFSGAVGTTTWNGTNSTTHSGISGEILG